MKKKKKKHLIMIMINILLQKNLISSRQVILLERLAQAKLVAKNDTADFVKKTYFNERQTNLK